MAGKGNEMAIWNENGKQKVHKHYLKMFLKEAYALHLENCIKEDENVVSQHSATFNQRMF